MLQHMVAMVVMLMAMAEGRLSMVVMMVVQVISCHGHGVMVMVAFSVSNGEGGESEGGHDGVTKGGMAVRLVMRVVLMVILARLDRG